MVSKLAQDFGDQSVDVFGLAIRESDLDQTRNDFISDGYQHALVLDGEPLVSTFKARVYPTIVVIDGDGEIVFQQSIKRDMSSEELVVEARESIQELINDSE